MIMCLNTALQVNIPPHLGGQEIRKNMEVEHDNGMEKLPVSQRISHMQDLTYMSRNTKHLSYQCAVRDNISLHLLLISGGKEGSLIKLSSKSIFKCSRCNFCCFYEFLIIFVFLTRLKINFKK
jgi:hypothetical protein